MVTNETHTKETHTKETYTKETEMTEKKIKEHEVEPEGKPISNLDKCDICMEDFTINGLKFCGNSVKDGKTECKYKMCEKCLIELKRKLRSKCPQCRNKILVKIILENGEESEDEEGEEEYVEDEYTDEESEEEPTAEEESEEKQSSVECCLNCLHCTFRAYTLYGTCCCCLMFNVGVGMGFYSIVSPTFITGIGRCDYWASSLCIGVIVNSAIFCGCKNIDDCYKNRYGRPIFDEDRCICCCYKYSNKLCKTCEKIWDSDNISAMISCGGSELLNSVDNQEMERE